MSFNPCFLIPVYNHKDTLVYMLEKLAPYGLTCIMVDDGSDKDCQDEMEKLTAQYDWVRLFRLPENTGKGAAVMCGFRHAVAAGFTHAFQVDADGQHNLERIAETLEVARRHPEALVLGYAVYNESVPKSRLWGRYITHAWVWVETLSFAIRDAMCGFRIYPLASCMAIVARHRLCERMEFDIEIAVRSHWAGVPVINQPVEVNYPLDGISHFDALRDNVLISKAHAMLFFTLLARLPRRLVQAGKGAVRD